MFTQLGQVMLYVDNQDESVRFWTEKLGFVVVDEANDGMRWIEIAPSKEAETTIMLHDKKKVAEMSPELNLDTPSLMFFTENLEQLHEELKSKNVKVGKIVQMPMGRVFNFSDDEENYFAVMEGSK
ncbi:VOC family protein [Halobacillus yeomjeoni]|uniref:VOC family protein n=1 Tax=Halobacillus yeomjeoni TaxID=311194 RepID=A0A931HX51_9BACI|nr:VOC family protein [Halobacillus yeomjeoni]MBH0231472.1 VOC family protein [Halobacillus yeomjeoni]